MIKLSRYNFLITLVMILVLISGSYTVVYGFQTTQTPNLDKNISKSSNLLLQKFEAKSIQQKNLEVPVQDTSFESPLAKNVILFIGDGMGEEHMKAARWYQGGLEGSLAMDGLSYQGYIETYSANRAITDSAAAGTAMATGVKTNNGVIGMDQYLHSLPTILEQAKQAGKSVGLVTTTMVSHATPAAFIAHVANRGMMNDIALQIIDSDIDLLLGGGEDEFYPANLSGCFPEKGERQDGRNLIEELIPLGYTYVCAPEDLLNYDLASSGHFMGLFADEGMVYPFSPTLEEMTSFAIELLSQNPKGYFLMVEGGQIDWAGHGNDALGVILYTISFDNAVKAALEIPEVTNNTLIIVTADHETGGMTTSLDQHKMRGEDGPYQMPDGNKFYVNWTTTKHTAAPVPVTATGPLSHWFIGIHDNTHIYDVMSSALFGIQDFDSLMLPEDIDGDGTADHSLVCPWQNSRSGQINLLELYFDFYSFGLGDK